MRPPLLPLALASLFAVGPAQAQVQVDLSPVFTGDYVRNTGDSTDTSGMDGIDTVLVTEAIGGAGRGLPNDGRFAADGNHPEVQLAATDTNAGDNGVLLGAGGQVTVAVPSGTYGRLQAYLFSTEGDSPTQVTLTYADTSEQTRTFTVSDWFADPPASPLFYLVDGMNRFALRSNSVEQVVDPAVFGVDLSPDPTRALASVSFSNTGGGTGRLVILGMTGEQPSLQALPNAYSVEEDGVLTVTASAGVLVDDIDPDDLPLTASIESVPTHGELVLRPDGSFIYTPDPDYFGADHFEYRATNGASASAVGAVSLTVTPVNDPPVARDDTYDALPEDVQSILRVLDNDDDGPDEGEYLRVASVGASREGGTVETPAGRNFVWYTPPAGFEGEDVFEYTITDGTSGSEATAQVTLTVGRPRVISADDAYSVVEDEVLTVAAAEGVLANDADPLGGAFTAQLVRGPTMGTLELRPDGGFVYTPDLNVSGRDEFTYTADNEDGPSLEAVVGIEISPANDPPRARDDEVEATAGLAVRVDVLGNDTAEPDEGEALEIVAVSGPNQGGAVEIVEGGAALSYTPLDGFEGTETFTYTITDGVEGSTAEATVTAQVTGPQTNLPVGDSEGCNSVAGSDAGLGVLLGLGLLWARRRRSTCRRRSSPR